MFVTYQQRLDVVRPLLLFAVDGATDKDDEKENDGADDGDQHVGDRSLLRTLCRDFLLAGRLGVDALGIDLDRVAIFVEL